ncbi:MAG TPA: leucyl aminopeptidase [Baekduia sp.]|nr:leucyl aminopeptidase [Baekduia sp.]
MRVTATTKLPIDTTADTVVVGLIEDEKPKHDPGGALADLLRAGEADAKFKHLALTHTDGKRWITVGLGKRSDLSDERLRVAASLAYTRAAELGCKSLCVELPHDYAGHPARSTIEGVLFTAYRYSLKRDAADDDSGVEELLLSDHNDKSRIAANAVILTEAVNRARDLENAPANLMTPTALAERAQAIEGVKVEVTGRDGIAALGMGAFHAVAQGSAQEPQLIVLSYDSPDAKGPKLGLVGKAVTFDSGGISIKPSAKMEEMKFDMSGGAAVIEAIAAIAAMQLPISVVGVVGATENLPSSTAVKPGDVVTAYNGLTIEVDNTDAEGRLVLADCLCHARALGAERLIDVATLTGAVIVALGSTYTGVMGTDDEWITKIIDVGAEAGELIWRLPLHDEYSDAMKGTIADLTNAPAARKAGTITAAAFLQRFTDDVPWAHLDIAGTAWDTGKPYFGKGPTGSMVRTMVRVAEGLSAGD